MNNLDDLFISQVHPTSRRGAILDDNGRSAWLYLIDTDTKAKLGDCWLYNRVPTPETFSSARGEQPVVPLTHSSVEATRSRPLETSVRLLWSTDGNSVAVYVDANLLGFILANERRGYSKLLRSDGPFGHPLNIASFEAAFGEAT